MVIESSVSPRPWIQSSKCTNGADLCLQMAAEPDRVSVRGTTTPHVELDLTYDQWRTFVAGVVAGEFDR
ncbi:DUF397 domain-containing protein [Virgisporangium aurantiacum]|uniref:DUF397 domain-containing protein n=1 Tax=Virgisporangium aurantiacum TaxID=175570 RepID=A0A8J3ZFY4_9ACTN|nr:DUF397 domain-containing protein [Virgisporangium aurantiacum]GIJ63224.1 hypothetical protein Vau01_107400 [Virgisporangium aurantiacum]